MVNTDKAFNAAVKANAHKIAKEIGELPATCSDFDVLNIIKAQKSDKEVLCSAFNLLDSNPLKFAEPDIWHPRLRRLRNNVEIGPELFSLFEGN